MVYKFIKISRRNTTIIFVRLGFASLGFRLSLFWKIYRLIHMWHSYCMPNTDILNMYDKPHDRTNCLTTLVWRNVFSHQIYRLQQYVTFVTTVVKTKTITCSTAPEIAQFSRRDINYGQIIIDITKQTRQTENTNNVNEKRSNFRNRSCYNHREAI